MQKQILLKKKNFTKKINDIQLQCNMDASISSPNPSPEPQGSGTVTLEANPQE